MTSRTFELLKNQTDPHSVIKNVVFSIIQAEAKYPISKELKAFHDNLKTNYRSWGQVDGEMKDFQLDTSTHTIKARYESDEYYSGEYMGTVDQFVEIPDALVETVEQILDASFDELSGIQDKFDEILNSHTTAKIERIKAQYDEENAKELLDAISMCNPTEDAERALLAQLKAKYPE